MFTISGLNSINTIMIWTAICLWYIHTFYYIRVYHRSIEPYFRWLSLQVSRYYVLKPEVVKSSLSAKLITDVSCNLVLRKFQIQERMPGSKFREESLEMRRSWGMQSKAFEKSRKMASVWWLGSMASQKLWMNFASCLSHQKPFQDPCWWMKEKLMEFRWKNTS